MSNSKHDRIGELDVTNSADVSSVNRHRSSIGRQIHHIVDGTGKFADSAAEIGATSIGHVGSIAGHIAGGVKNLFVKGWRSYSKHDLDPPNHTAA